MNIIEQKKNERFKVMEKIYLITHGVEKELLNIVTLLKALDLPETEESLESLVKIINYLANEELIITHHMHRGVPTHIQIAHKGIIEVEQALSDPKSETEHFAPNITITNNIGSMVNSNLQQANSNSQQTILYLNESEKSDFNEQLLTLKKEIEEHKANFTQVQQQDISAELSTIESQMQSSRPKKKIISSSLETLNEILKGAAGSGSWELISAMAATMA